MPPSKTDSQRLCFQDGSNIGFATWGDRHGRPVFQFHGTPGSRLELFGPEELFRQRRIHLITIDRPGYGLSDYVPISLLDWPARVAAVADAIGVDKFALIGMSAGTPFALAVAAALPERVSGVATAGGLAPPGNQQDWSRFGRLSRLGLNVVHRWPSLVTGFYSVALGAFHVLPDQIIDLMTREDDPVDRELLADRDFRWLVRAMISEGTRRGVQGAVHDLQLATSPWGFDLRSIDQPIDIWHGTRDHTVPVSEAHRLHRMLHGSRLFVLRGEGHFLLWRRAAEVLTPCSNLPDRRFTPARVQSGVSNVLLLEGPVDATANPLRVRS